MRLILQQNNGLYELIKESQYETGRFNLQGKKYSPKGLFDRLESMNSSEIVDFSRIEAVVDSKTYAKILDSYGTSRENIINKELV